MCAASQQSHRSRVEARNANSSSSQVLARLDSVERFIIGRKKRAICVARSSRLASTLALQLGSLMIRRCGVGKIDGAPRKMDERGKTNGAPRHGPLSSIMQPPYTVPRAPATQRAHIPHSPRPDSLSPRRRLPAQRRRWRCARCSPCLVPRAVPAALRLTGGSADNDCKRAASVGRCQRTGT
jgi:hypothetical protein